MSLSDVLVRTREQNILFSALLELTYRCNLDCFFCYNDLGLKGTPLSTRQYLTLFDDLASLDSPEAYPGQLGHGSVSLLITRIKPGTYTFNQQWYYPHHSYPLTPEGVQRYMNIQNHPLVVKTKYGNEE